MFPKEACNFAADAPNIGTDILVLAVGHGKAFPNTEHPTPKLERPGKAGSSHPGRKAEGRMKNAGALGEVVRDRG
jgi:hypothetical protein